MTKTMSSIQHEIGPWPYRLVLAGGWIDQPFMNEHNPEPPGAMVVVSLVPTVRFMERSGMATSTRKIAQVLWPSGVPYDDDPQDVVEDLYHAENDGKENPSGSQDMVGLICPGVSRLAYGHGATFPVVSSRVDEPTCAWLEKVLWLIPVCPRPEGYDPLMVKNLDPRAVARLGRNGLACWEAVMDRDVDDLGRALTEYELAASAVLPCHLEHPVLSVHLRGLWEAYASTYPGATYSGPGGGYMVVASEQAVPGAFQVTIRRK